MELNLRGKVTITYKVPNFFLKPHFFFLDFLKLLCVRVVFDMHMCVSHVCPMAAKARKKALDSVGLELQTVVRSCAGTGPRSS